MYSGKDFRKTLIDLDWNFIEAAAYLGVSPVTIGNYAHGRTPIPRAVKIALDTAIYRQEQERSGACNVENTGN